MAEARVKRKRGRPADRDDAHALRRLGHLGCRRRQKDAARPRGSVDALGLHRCGNRAARARVHRRRGLRHLWAAARQWSVKPDPSDLAGHLHSPEYEEAGLTEWIGDGLAESVAFNEKLLITNGLAVRAAAICVGVMAVLVIGLAITVN